MKIFISVVSHNHGKLIEKLDILSNLESKDIIIIVKNNTHDPIIEKYCKNRNIILLNENYNKGFGENNNIVYKYIIENLKPNNDDFFLVLNPDVKIDLDTLNKFTLECYKNSSKLSTLNLFTDEDLKTYDNNIRNYPKFTTFLKSFLLKKNDSILNKSEIHKICKVDWAAGSFLLFNIEHYKKIGGFNSDYFMYCEDIDICYRSNLINEKVNYYPHFSAIHLAKHENKKLFSKHFFWHIKSAFLFLKFKRKFTNE